MASVGVVVFSGEGVAEKSSGVLLVGEEIAASVDALCSGTGMTWNFAGVAFVSVSDAGFQVCLERLFPNMRSVWSLAISVSASLSDSPSEVSILSVSLLDSMSVFCSICSCSCGCVSSGVDEGSGLFFLGQSHGMFCRSTSKTEFRLSSVAKG